MVTKAHFHWAGREPGHDIHVAIVSRAVFLVSAAAGIGTAAGLRMSGFGVLCF